MGHFAPSWLACHSDWRRFRRISLLCMFVMSSTVPIDWKINQDCAVQLTNPATIALPLI
jgi:hypothetical protein